MVGQPEKQSSARQEWHEGLLMRLSDMLSSVLIDMNSRAEEEYVRCSLQQMYALEGEYGHTQTAVVTGLVREAANRIGIVLNGYRIERVEEKPRIRPVKLVSFDDLIGKLQQ